MITETEMFRAVHDCVDGIDKANDGVLTADSQLRKCCTQSAFAVFAWLKANGFQIIGGSCSNDRPAPIAFPRS